MSHSKLSPEELVKEFAPRVRQIAGKVSKETRYLVDRDDLIQAGFVGLLEAGQRYEPNTACTLKTFVGKRIRGAMLDEIRRNDPCSRGVRKFQREKGQALKRLQSKQEGKVSEEVVAFEMGYTPDQFKSWNRAPVVELKSIPFEGEECDPQLILASHNDPAESETRRRMNDYARTLVEVLPSREGWVMQMTLEGDTQAEIARKFGMSAEGIKQIKGRASKKLRGMVGAV